MMPRRALLLGGGALAALSLAACTWPSPRRIEAANPPRGRFVEVDGLSVHYAAMGPEDAPAVVLIHGATGNLNDMTFDLAPRLAEGHRVIAFDRPGLGYTDRPEEEGWDPRVQARILRAAADRLGVEDPVVLGHSWGGAVALAWGLQAPERVRGLVLVSAAIRPWGGGPGLFDALRNARPVAGATAAVLYNWYLRSGGESAAERIFRPQPVPEGYLDHLQAELIARPESFRANMVDIDRLSPILAEMERRYDSLDMPIAVLHGTADRIVAASVHSEPLAERLPNAELALFEGVGHMLHHARPQAVADAVRRLARPGGEKGESPATNSTQKR